MAQLEAIGRTPRGRRQYMHSDGKPATLDATIAEIEFKGEVVGGTIRHGDETAVPLLVTATLDSFGFGVDLCNESGSGGGLLV